MFQVVQCKKYTNTIFRLFSLTVAFVFLAITIVPSQALAQGALALPVPGTMVTLSPAFIPAILRGIQVDPQNPLKFGFILDTGDSELKDDALKQES